MNIQDQVNIIEEMQSAGFNVCTCGNCGNVVLYNQEEKDKDTIVCPHCKADMAYCDMPDLYYEGMPELDKERDEQDKL